VKWELEIAPPISCPQAIGAFSYMRADPGNLDRALPANRGGARPAGAATYEGIVVFGQGYSQPRPRLNPRAQLTWTICLSSRPRVNAQVTRVAMGFRSLRRQGSFAVTGGM
jgi:hypothetical protein